MITQAKLYVMYHDPCLDGIYSLLGIMLPIITKIRRDGWKITDILKQIDLSLNAETPNSNINYDDQSIDNQSASFFYTSIDGLVYLPIRLGNQQDEAIRMIKNLKDKSNDSILISVDYAGRTLEALEYFKTQFKYVIIVDHHETCINELKKLKEYDPIKHQKLNKLNDNLYVMVDNTRAACEIVQDFAEIIFGGEYEKLVPKNLGVKLKKFTKFIGDSDMQILQYEESEPLNMAIMQLRYDSNAKVNEMIFYKLLDLNMDLLLKKGQILVQERKQKVKKLIKDRKTFFINKDARGYAIQCSDLSILNHLGNTLAELSMRSGDHNLGAVYHDCPNDVTQYKIHFRSAHHSEDKKLLPRYRCDLLAEKFGGGGHIGAASMFMNKKKWREFVYQ